MKNEEAVKCIERIIDDNGIYGTSPLTPHAIEALYTAISAIESQRWIPVTERLPDGDFQKYFDIDDEYPTFLVLIKDAILPTTLQFDGERFCDCTINGWIFYEVTHWMPIPEPPKEEST